MMKKKAIIPTEAGIELINILPKEIKSADYTAKMEADLDLVQAVVILVENLFGRVQILADARLLAPGQVDQRLDEVAHDRRFRRHRRHQLELLELGLGLGEAFLAHSGVLDRKSVV